MQHFIRYRLFLGRNIDTEDQQGVVNDTALAAWLKREVTPRYDGFTLYTAMGSWKGEHEKSAVLEIMVEYDQLPHLIPAKELPEPIKMIIESYKSTFWQECVMVEVSPVVVSFV